MRGVASTDEGLRDGRLVYEDVKATPPAFFSMYHFSIGTIDWVGGVFEGQLVRRGGWQQKSPDFSVRALVINMAATYSPAWLCSTIGHEGLNFSVRDGKR